jgi:hypothetical protein
MKRKFEMGIYFAAAALMGASLAEAGGNAGYIGEKPASVVVTKLDVSSLPDAFRPKKEKGKKTLGEYGYTVQTEGENFAQLTGGDGRTLSINILQQSGAGIYACFGEQKKEGQKPETQSVVLLHWKGSTGMLTGRQSWKEFGECPVVGGDEAFVTTPDVY